MNATKNTLLTCLMASLISACSSSGGSGDSLRLSSVTTATQSGASEVTTLEYSRTGLLEAQRVTLDGQEVSTTHFVIADTGEFSESGDDLDQDGEADTKSYYEYVDGLGLSRIYRSNDAGFIDTVEIFRWENSMIVSSDVRDIDDVASIDQVNVASGRLQSRQIFSYSDGRLDSISSDTDGNGSTDTLENFSYNPDGGLASSTLNSLAGGTLASSTYTYQRGRCDNTLRDSTTAFMCVSGN